MRIEEVKIIGDVDEKMIQPAIKQVANSDADAFLLRINTEGGDVEQTFQLISELKNTGKPFYAINEGFAISCGAIILASADKSYGYPYSISLIHNPFYAETEEVDEFLVKVKDSLMSILSNKIKTDNLSQLLDDETVWNANEAKSYGLIDEIIGVSQIAVNTYTKDEVKSFFNNKKILNSMDKELQEKIQEEIQKEVTEEVKEETQEQPVQTEEQPQVPQEEEIKNECGEGKEEVKNESVEEEVKTETETEEVKNEGEGDKIAELERLITEKDAYIAELEAKLEEATGKKEEVINKETVNKLSAEAIESIKHLFDSEAVLNSDDKLAEKIFDINGDETLRLRIREKQPELYNKLLIKYYSK